ncbi:MAG: acetyl-CoA carboxylase biotin carboxyl carrier protein [Saprospiraceae bacterium]|nr:acetyl-CoA carboxylase biotin carboxyl carrier protein [Saprospiraceae bacterium]
MTFEEIKSLIQLVNKSDLAEFKFEDGDQKITIRTSKYCSGKQQIIQSVAAPASILSPSPAPVTTPAPSAAPVVAPIIAEAPKAATANTEGGNYLEIKSPIVGTFYRAAGTDKPPYVKVGDKVEKGKVVCIVEAMKLFNEIESEIQGKIVKICIEDASPVEYDQVLFLVDPKG